MKKLALLALGAYALSRFGRAAVFGELAGAHGDEGARALANNLTITEAIAAGARKLTGSSAASLPN